MRWLKVYLLVVAICSVIGGQIGCGGDEEATYIGQNLSDEEILTKQKLYETADWDVRWKKSRAARKRYIKLRDTYPNEALNAYIEYRNWMDYGHRLAAEAAKLSVKMDMLGKTNIPDTLKLLDLELKMANDLKRSKKHIEEIEEDILFWSELAKELEDEGHDPADFEIEFEIGEGLE